MLVTGLPIVASDNMTTEDVYVSELFDGMYAYDQTYDELDIYYLDSEANIRPRGSVPEMHISLNPNGGIVTPNHVVRDQGGTFGVLPRPTRANHDFLYWIDRNGTQIHQASRVPIGSTFSDSMTLTARWRTVRCARCLTCAISSQA